MRYIANIALVLLSYLTLSCFGASREDELREALLRVDLAETVSVGSSPRASRSPSPPYAQGRPHLTVLGFHAETVPPIIESPRGAQDELGGRSSNVITRVFRGLSKLRSLGKRVDQSSEQGEEGFQPEILQRGRRASVVYPEPPLSHRPLLMQNDSFHTFDRSRLPQDRRRRGSMPAVLVSADYSRSQLSPTPSVSSAMQEAFHRRAISSVEATSQVREPRNSKGEWCQDLINLLGNPLSHQIAQLVPRSRCVEAIGLLHKLEQKLEEYRRNARSFRDTIRALRTRLEEQSKAVETFQVQRDNAINTSQDLQLQLGRASQQTQLLQSKLNAVECDVQSFGHLCKVEKQTVENLRAQLEAAQCALKSQQQESDRRYRDIRSQLVEANRTIERLQEQLETAMGNTQALRDELTGARHQAGILESQLSSAKERVHLLQLSLNTRGTDLRNRVQELQVARDTIQNRDQRIEELEGRCCRTSGCVCKVLASLVGASAAIMSILAMSGVFAD